MALVIENLGLSRGKKRLFNQLSAEFNRGEIWGILGCNGSGKTSLLHTLAGIIPPSAGKIKLNQQNLTTRANRQRALEIALLLQHYDDNFPATVMETVLIGRHPHCHYFRFESSHDREIAKSVLQQLEILSLQNRDIRTLSGGERQRVAIAMVLAQQANYYLLDEPLNHLDIKYQMQVLNHFKSLAKRHQKSIIMSLHDINHAYQFCDKLILLTTATTLRGDCKTLLTEENLSELYQHPIKIIQQNQTAIFIPQ